MRVSSCRLNLFVGGVFRPYRVEVSRAREFRALRKGVVDCSVPGRRCGGVNSNRASSCVACEGRSCSGLCVSFLVNSKASYASRMDVGGRCGGVCGRVSGVGFRDGYGGGCMRFLARGKRMLLDFVSGNCIRFFVYVPCGVREGIRGRSVRRCLGVLFSVGVRSGWDIGREVYGEEVIFYTWM